ncbi:hypothetical protein THRCLA_20811 [Thraustotheca clavata]|uniref:Uncharacterized protein n=1 Tax=Thraustotheca clavata TaxID=74557 RepID=A0A1W0A369_9STRA|nr:hypothetical protein THRCLA_20811 [Thraustotheca clavata]
MDALNDCAKTICDVPEFERPNIDGKKSQQRFNILIEQHREYNKTSQRASGIDQEEDEKSYFT